MTSEDANRTAQQIRAPSLAVNELPSRNRLRKLVRWLKAEHNGETCDDFNPLCERSRYVKAVRDAIAGQTSLLKSGQPNALWSSDKLLSSDRRERGSAK